MSIHSADRLQCCQVCLIPVPAGQYRTGGKNIIIIRRINAGKIIGIIGNATAIVCQNIVDNIQSRSGIGIKGDSVSRAGAGDINTVVIDVLIITGTYRKPCSG